jgi:hypothetical protein
MKLTNLIAQSTTLATKGGGNAEERMAVLLAASPRLYPMGKLLANTIGGKSLAQHIADGEVIEMDTVSGFPLNPGYVIGLKSDGKSTVIVGDWACPACKSAHGSNVFPSKKGIKVKGLLSNRFYYNPATKELFSISDTCFETYVAEKGEATKERFAPAPPSPLKSKKEATTTVAA